MSKSPSRRGNDLHNLRRQDLTPASGVVRRMAEKVLHKRVVPDRGRVMAPEVKHGAKRKWSDEEVRTMRRRHAAGERICDLAREFGTHYNNMSMILDGRAYSWIV